MDNLRKRHKALVDNVDLRFEREIINDLPWSEKLISIKGSRGIGKTTLLLQYIKKCYGESGNALYISLDDPYFFNTSLIEFAEDSVSNKF